MPCPLGWPGLSREAGPIVVPSNLTLSVTSPSRTCLETTVFCPALSSLDSAVSRSCLSWSHDRCGCEEMPTNPNSPSQLLRNRNLFALTAQCSHWLGMRWAFPLYITDVHTNCKEAHTDSTANTMALGRLSYSSKPQCLLTLQLPKARISLCQRWPFINVRVHIPAPGWNIG